MPADDLLDALDPEQRAGRRGAARAGAGARRRRHRQDPGDHPPHRPRRRDAASTRPTEVLAVTFTTRAAGEMRTRLRSSGRRRRPGPHLPLRGAAPAALLLAARPRHRAAAADRVQARRCSPAPPAASGSTPTRRCCATSPPRSSGPRSATSAPTTTPRSPTARGRSVAGQTPETVGPRLRRLRGGQARPGPDGHGGRPAAHRRHAGRRRAGRRPGAPPVQVVRRRRVPGRLAAPVGAARPVARRPRRALRRRRPGPDDLLLRRRQRRLPARLPGQVPRHHLGRAGPQLPLHARRWSSAANTAARRHRRASGVELRSQQPAGPAVDLRRPPRRGGRGRGGRRPDRARCAPTGRALGEIAVLFRINAQSEAFEEALADARHPLRRPRRRPVLRPARGARGGHPASAAPPAPARPADGDAWLETVRGDARRHGLDAPSRRPPAARPATAGSRGRR